MTEGAGREERKGTKEERERRKRDEWREGKRGNGNIGVQKIPLLHTLRCVLAGSCEGDVCVFVWKGAGSRGYMPVSFGVLTNKSTNERERERE